MDCEICGRPAVAEAIVEGARLNVCAVCTRYGRVLAPQRAPSSGAFPALASRAPETELAPDYGKRIARARKQRGLSREDLARHAFIRVNELAHFEDGRLKPEEKVARKLEQFLGIQLLVEEPSSGAAPAAAPSSRSLSAPSTPRSPASAASSAPAEPTLGDFLVAKKKNA